MISDEANKDGLIATYKLPPFAFKITLVCRYYINTDCMTCVFHCDLKYYLFSLGHFPDTLPVLLVSMFFRILNIRIEMYLLQELHLVVQVCQTGIRESWS